MAKKLKKDKILDDDDESSVEEVPVSAKKKQKVKLNRNISNSNTKNKKKDSNKKTNIKQIKNSSNKKSIKNEDSDDSLDYDNLESKVLPGQKFPTPPKGDPLRAFYESMLKLKKNSLMGLKYCIEHGCLSRSEAEAGLKKLLATGVSKKK